MWNQRWLHEQHSSRIDNKLKNLLLYKMIKPPCYCNLQGVRLVWKSLLIAPKISVSVRDNASHSHTAVKLKHHFPVWCLLFTYCTASIWLWFTLILNYNSLIELVYTSRHCPWFQYLDQGHTRCGLFVPGFSTFLRPGAYQMGSIWYLMTQNFIALWGHHSTTKNKFSQKI